MNKPWKRRSILTAIGGAVIALLFAAVPPAPGAETSPAADKAGADKPADNPLHLSAEKRRAAGIELAKPTSVRLEPAVEGFGRVIDPTPLVALLAEDETARASLVASTQELTRVKTLFEHGANASAQVVETAEANVAKDRAAADSARLRLVASWGRELALPEQAAALRSAMGEGAELARLDVLPGAELAPAIKHVSVRLASGGATVDAEVLGNATLVDPQVQGAGLVVLIRSGSLPVGAALRAMLPARGEPKPAFIVPRGAIVYHQGSAWVYVLGDKDVFERKLVTIARPSDSGVTITAGIDADDQVAVTGAEELLAAELQSGSGPED